MENIKAPEASLEEEKEKALNLSAFEASEEKYNSQSQNEKDLLRAPMESLDKHEKQV